MNQPAKTAVLLSLCFLGACVPVDTDPANRPIRTQSDVDRYNASVSSEEQKLVCTREQVLGTNFRELVCMTVAQRDRMARQSSETMDAIRGQQQALE